MSDINSAKTILVIDDEAIIRQSFCDQLEDLGFRVMSAEHGRAGVDIIENEHVDLVLTDMRMPQLSGLEVIRQSKLLAPDLPIIVISGAGRIGDAVEALRLGAYDYLIKPVKDLDVLEHAVNKAFERSQLVRENRDYQDHLEDLVQERTKDLEQANQRQATINIRLKKAVETTKMLSGCTKVTTFGRLILREFAEQMDSIGGSFYLVEEDGLYLIHALDVGHANDFLPFPLAENSVLARVMATGEPLLVEDVNKTNDIEPSGWGDYRDGSLLAFPILEVSKTPVGVLTLHNKSTPPFIEQDKEIGSILASYSCETLRAAKAFESLSLSKKRYKTLFDKTNDAIFLVQKETGRYLDANTAAELLTGRPLKELMMLSTGDVILEDANDRFSSAVETEMNIDIRLVAYHRPDGTERMARLSTVSLDDDTIINIARDITEEHETEKQLRRALKMDAIGKLTGGIAHDFNNILCIIHGNLELLDKQFNFNGKAGKRMKSLQKAAFRASDLTKQLLGFSRNKAIQDTEANVGVVIQGMKSLIDRTVTPEVEVEQHFATDLWLTKIDVGDFEDALLNLVINARDAITGSGRLILETSNCSLDQNYCEKNSGFEPGEYVLLTVSDTGAGIPSNKQEQIFDPFYTTKPLGKGTGLGLSMVFGFVSRSRGFIQVYSEVGHGSTFRLYLPRAQGKEKAASVKSIPIEEPCGGQEVILAVDDEEGLLELARESLSALGYRVLTATDAPNALKLLTERQGIDLLFSDVVMPGGMSGFELAEKAVAICPNLKVQLTSGFTGQAMSNNKQTSLAVNLLFKPYSQNELAQRVRTLLSSKPEVPE